MATITKRDLVISISNDTGLTQQQVFSVLQKFLDTSTDHLSKGDEVVLRNFGTFEIRKTKPKVGRNPNKPGSEVTIPARSIVKFRAGKALKDRVAKLPSK